MKKWAELGSGGKLWRSCWVGYICITATMLGVGRLSLVFKDPPTPEEIKIAAERQETINRAIEEKKVAEEREVAESRKKGFHCLSTWDGQNRSLERLVISAMNDPDSFDHVETLIGPKNKDGQHFIKMKYRGRNGFGGMVIESVSGYVSNNTCEITSISSSS